LPGNLILCYKLKSSAILAGTVIKLTTTQAKGTNMEIYMVVFSDGVTEVAV